MQVSEGSDAVPRRSTRISAFRSLEDPEVRARIDAAETRARAGHATDAPGSMRVEALGAVIDDLRAGRPYSLDLEDPQP